MAHALVVFYSRSGHTRQLAETIADRSGWDLEPVLDMRSRSGILGYLRSGLEAVASRLTPIGPSRRDPRDYDIVIVGSPVWNASLSSPIRTYLEQYRGELRSVAFFVTEGGRGAQRVFSQMAEITGVDPVATLELRERDLRAATIDSRVQQFVAAIEAAIPRPTAPPPQPGASA